ncbi:MAG: 23S rRNA (pseudouridine(1915)-N(3))-methyltransferase RlmH [Firmicutes bacterium]|nr:23S rRNA (pseudouridine(1915)-N(3))-methyltransferase RlmH [Bacillota bacterium]
MMKKIDLLCVGKLKEPYFAAAVAEYTKRLSRFCAFTVTEVPDAGDSESSVLKESAAVFQKIGERRASAFVILLDRAGEPVSSEGFAKAIDTAFARGAERVHLIIGGSRGVSEELKSAADKRLSFGAVTYPHQLMRVIAAEQVYRAMCILGGTPYHK